MTSEHGARGRLTFTDRPFVPLAFFVFIYLAAFFPAASVTAAAYRHVVAVSSVMVATAVTVGFLERGDWRIGLLVSPRAALREAMLGATFALLLVGAAHAAVLATTRSFQAAGDGVPWHELALVFIPAALHEELLFRGYCFQKLRAWRRRFGIIFIALVFALLHAANAGITLLALLNLFIAGLLLGLAYERYERLWFPIGIHVTWNLLSGPILGYQVSGYGSESTLLETVTIGEEWLTGGAFGIEGSIWITVAEVIGVAWLLSRGQLSVVSDP